MDIRELINLKESVIRAPIYTVIHLDGEGELTKQTYRVTVKPGQDPFVAVFGDTPESVEGEQYAEVVSADAQGVMVVVYDEGVTIAGLNPAAVEQEARVQAEQYGVSGDEYDHITVVG